MNDASNNELNDASNNELNVLSNSEMNKITWIGKNNQNYKLKLTNFCNLTNYIAKSSDIEISSNHITQSDIQTLLDKKELSLAPMMKVTTPFFRILIRKTCKSVVLFTEMIVSSTVIHVTNEKLKIILGEPEDLTVVQLGGSSPDELLESVKILKQLGWKSFNLNCGCPSERVQNGKFGAIMMLEKETVANIINKIYKETGVIISLKIRIGVDNNDSFEFFSDFIEYIIKNTPCIQFYVHARKCWLCGLNPKQNRNVPSLNYQFVYDVKKKYPHIFISLNGGIKENSLDKIKNLDGLMIGRHAIEDIFIFYKYEKMIDDEIKNEIINEKLNEKEKDGKSTDSGIEYTIDKSSSSLLDEKSTDSGIENTMNKSSSSLLDEKSTDTGIENTMNKSSSSLLDIKQIIKEYLKEGARLLPPKSKLLIPLINLRKGKPLCKHFRQVINELIHNPIEYDEIYERIEPFLEDVL